MFDVHHLIFDGTSVTVFLNEISYLYEKETPACEEGMRGNDERQKLFKQEMKSEVCSLLDMASKEEALKTTPQYQAAREYFQKKLADVEAGDSLLKDYRPKTVRAVCDTVRVSLGEPLSIMAAEQFVRQNGISENTLFLGAFAYALGKYTGENKSLFCTVNNGRHTAELSNSVGMFVKTLPMVQSWEETSLVSVYLQAFQQNFYETMEHDCISFGELAREYGIASDILFVYQGEMLNGLSLGGRRYPANPVPPKDVQADISVMVMKGQGGYEITLDYRTDLYRRETVRGLQKMFVQVLQGMLTCRTLQEITLVSESDLRLLESFHGEPLYYDTSKTVVDLFREQVKRAPERTAVIYKDRTYTYAQLDDLTDRLAAHTNGRKPNGTEGRNAGSGDSTKPGGTDSAQVVPATIGNGRIVTEDGRIDTFTSADLPTACTVLQKYDEGGSPAGAVTVTVVCEEEACTVGVADTAAVANAILTSGQIQFVQDGGTIEIRIHMTDISGNVPQQDQDVIKDAIEKAAEHYPYKFPGLTSGMYVDISAMIRVGDGEWNAITQSEEPVEVVIGIPETLQAEGREYYTIRVHEGKYTFMDDLDDQPDTITIRTDRFSSYAIAFMDTGDTRCWLCHICPTFLGICCFVWLAAFILVILVLVVVNLLWKKEKKDKKKRKKKKTCLRRP